MWSTNKDQDHSMKFVNEKQHKRSGDCCREISCSGSLCEVVILDHFFIEGIWAQLEHCCVKVAGSEAF